MVFAIRDDDVSYFTNPSEIIAAYDSCEVPITLSVVPEAISHHGNSYHYGNGPFDREYGLIGDNTDLVAHIKTGMQQNRYEVIMHGIHHEYRPSPMRGGEWIPEMVFLSFNEQFDLLQKYKDYLEKTFEAPIRAFAAPSNTMGKDAFKCCELLGLNTMCLLSKHIDHPISLSYLGYYFHRNIARAIHKDVPMIMQYKNHCELPISPLRDPDTMWEWYCNCKKHHVPFIIYTHYWELNQNNNLKRYLQDMVQRMLDDGAAGRFVSECYPK